MRLYQTESPLASSKKLLFCRDQSNGCCALGITIMVSNALDTPIVDDGDALIGPWRTPQQMLASQVYDGHVSIHDNAMAQKVGFKVPRSGETELRRLWIRDCVTRSSR